MNNQDSRLPWLATTLLGLIHLGLLDAVRVGYLAELSALPLVTFGVTTIVSTIGLLTLVHYLTQFDGHTRPRKRDASISFGVFCAIAFFYIGRLDLSPHASDIASSIHASILYTYTVGTLVTSGITTAILIRLTYTHNERSEPS